MSKQRMTLKDRSIDAHVFMGGSEKLPGVIFLHDLTGIQDSLLESAKIIANSGYHVIVPDLYSELGLPKYCLRILFDKMALTNEEGVVGLEEVQQIIDAFKEFPEVQGDRMGFIGQCLTGGYVLHAALRDDIKAPVLFHHSIGISDSGFPEHCASQINKTVQGHFSNFDFICPPSRVNALKEQLGDHLEKHNYNLPHAIPHLFRLTNEGKKAFDKMIDFLDNNLKN